MENFTPRISREEAQSIFNERKKIKLSSEEFKPRISREEAQKLFDEMHGNLNKSQEQQTSYLSRFGNEFLESAKQAATGLSEFGQDFSNLPKTLLSSLSLGKFNIPKSDINFAKLYGAQENPEGIIDRGIRGGFRELPAFIGNSPLTSGKYAIKAAEKVAPVAETFGKYAAGKIGEGISKINPFGSKISPVSARVLESAERGSASSFIKSEEPEESGLKGLELSGVQLGLESLGKGIGLGGKAIYKSIQSASEAPLSKELLNNISSEIGKELPKKLESFKTALGKHEELRSRESDAWLNTEKIASNTNISPKTVKSELNPVILNVEEKIKKYEEDTSENSKQIRDFLNRTKKDIKNTNNYSDVFKLGKNLNDLYGNASTKESRGVVKDIIREYKESVNKSLEVNGLSKLKNEWEKANNLTKEKYETFYDFTKKNGKSVRTELSKIINDYKNNPKSVVSPETFRKDFIPNLSGKSREEGVNKFIKLEDITGNKKLTQGELIKSIFNYRNKKIDPNDFLNTYNKLSDEQRSYLFSDKNNNVIKSLENLKKSNPDALSDLHIKRIINDTVLKIFQSAGRHATKIEPLKKKLEKDLIDKYSRKDVVVPDVLKTKKEKNKLSTNLQDAVKSYFSSNQ